MTACTLCARAEAKSDLVNVLSSLEAHWHVLEAEVLEINRDIEYSEQCLRKYGEWFNSPLQYLRELKRTKKNKMCAAPTARSPRSEHVGGVGPPSTRGTPTVNHSQRTVCERRPGFQSGLWLPPRGAALARLRLRVPGKGGGGLGPGAWGYTHLTVASRQTCVRWPLATSRALSRLALTPRVTPHPSAPEPWGACRPLTLTLATQEIIRTKESC